MNRADAACRPNHQRITLLKIVLMPMEKLACDNIKMMTVDCG